MSKALLLYSFVVLFLMASDAGAAIGAYNIADGAVTAPSASQKDYSASSDIVPPENVPSQSTESSPITEQQQEPEPSWPVPVYEVVNETYPPVVPAPDKAGAVDRHASNTVTFGDISKNREGVLQRFRTFSGERTVKNLVELYTSTKLAGVSQVPDIAVSDGISPLTIQIDSAVSGGAPAFSFRGANLESLRQLPDGTWELQAIPQKGKCLIYLSIKTGSDLVDLPLTVIPLSKADLVSSSESGVAALLVASEEKTGKMIYDLNGDGKQDYIDDYILIGHYLLNQPTHSSPIK